MADLFERDYVVRQATESDLVRLYELEQLCWQHSRASKQQIRARLKKYPQGQLVLERDQQVLGVIYSQRIASVGALVRRSAANVHQLHDESGQIVQILAVNADPAAHDLDVADVLLAFMLQQCRQIPGVGQVVAVEACKRFSAAGALSFDAYIQQQDSNQDPVLAFLRTHGAHVVQSIANYRSQDTDNQGYGVLVSFDLSIRAASSDSHLFVLSAANLERLQAYAGKVAKWLENSHVDKRFADAIYTWQVARTAMKRRLAIKVRNSADLRHKLKQWLENQDAAPDIWLGEANLRDESATRSGQGESGQQRLDQAIADKDWNQLGELWTSGADIDWQRLYAAGPGKPRRISVPTYSFAQERHWIEITDIAPQGPAASALDAAMEHVFVTPVWEPVAASKQSSPESADPIGKHYVALLEMPGADDKELASLLPSSDCAHLPQTRQAGVGERYVGYALACFDKVKTIFAEKPQGRVLLQVVVPNEPEPALLSGLSGLLKTATNENPNFIGQIILTDAQSTAALAAQLSDEKGRLDNAVVLYTRDGRHVLRWRPVGTGNTAGARPDTSFKERGVYLITGGLGGLGVVFAKEILRCAASARIILTGRSILSKERQEFLAQLSRQAVAQGGNPIEYRQLDVENPDQVAKLVADILKEYKQLNGIIHSAGMIADNMILNKTPAEFAQVLAPKVTGTVNLDAASSDVGLDFFALFSSAATVIGNSGQSDYAAANGFMDQFAAYRNRLVEGGKRTGQTLSINWPLWQDGGMAIDPASLEMLRRATGMRPMQTATGLRIFHESLAAKCSRTMVLEGDIGTINATLEHAPLAARGRAERRTFNAVNSERLKEETLKKVKQMFADVTKRPAAKINASEELAAYGIDSIIISKLNLGLTKVFGEISKTLFFEFKTLADLTVYLMKEYPAECVSWTGLEEHAAASGEADELLPVEAYRQSAHAQPYPGPIAAGPGPREPVAIVGISGIYPQAGNLEQFWANLQAGKDCVSEIPPDRWALDDFFNPDMDQAIEQGKSYSKWGGFIEEFAEFDSLFFNISPREALNMDPQERLFLQECWRALEDGGYTRSDLKDKFRQRVGVFTGITKPGYNLYAMHAPRAEEPFFPHTSFSSAANRISYFFDITGPSMPVDTMCSSSLTAIHEACEHIHRGECEVAFAGGVNLYLHPYTYTWLCSQRMLSRDGLCRSFGAGGSGYVPGEGVGVVLLKSLSSALRDNDHIHGLILATHVNHGGKTNGYTVPSPKVQAELIRHTIDKAGIKATDISYIEAHGTGTELGDPIEISGLQQAFAPDSEELGYCKIGSAKSTIGHLEAAAGIAALTKVLLQMKHKQIAPSLHAAELNPNIAFHKTAFRVNTHLSPWEPPQSAGGKPIARIAGISSFGAGGANAHIIVQEYVAPENAVPAAPRGEKVIIPLSARTAPQLEQRARDLVRFIRTAPVPVDLTAVADTLQVAREAMEERLSCLVSSVEQLADKLQAYVDGQKDIEEFYRGRATGNNDTLQLFGDDDDFQETLDRWIARRKLPQLAEIWTRGLSVDWNKLRGEAGPRRIALPTYPFAKERLWIDTVVDPVHSPAKAAQTALHPLLHANTSDLSRQRYSSVFTGDEFFLRDHKVNGQKILPAVAYLEMARTAVDLALPAPVEGALLELRNSTWALPIAVSGPKEVSIALYTDESDDQIDFEVYSADASAQAEQAQHTLHCQGQAVFIHMSAPSRLDVEQLRAAMTKGAVDVAGIYQNFSEMGVDYGAAHRAIKAVYLGEQQLLAQLNLPAVVASSGNAYQLHPSLMDSALQASICLMSDTIRQSRQPLLPFALETLRVVAPCTGEMFAWVRRAPSAHAADSLVKFDVDLCDQLGNICVQLQGFSSRALEGERKRSEPQLHSLVPVWNRVSAPEQKLPASAHILLVGGGQGALEWARKSYPGTQLLELSPNAGVDSVQEKLKDRSFDHLLWVAPDAMEDGVQHRQERMIEAQDEGVLTVYRLAKALANLEHAHKNLKWTLITRNTERVKKHDAIAPAHAGISGFVGSLAKEYPEWDLRLLDVDKLESVAADECLSWPGDKQGDGLAYRQKEWFRQGLGRLDGLPESLPAYRQGGVYVVIGGAGGIGEVWSRFMLERYDAKLVWIGRRALDSTIEAKMKSLSQLGRAPVYFSADAAKLDSLQQVHQKILEIYPEIHGVVHSAIDLQDQSVALMDETTFRGSLSAKVDVSVNLDRVFGDHDLDFVLYFSSLISFTKGPGQSNYAAGCTFKDSFAHSLAQRRRYPIKIMNWGYWGNVGVVTSDFYNKRMQQRGIGSIEAPEAMECLQALISSELNQIALIKTLDDRALDEIALPESASCFPRQFASVVPEALQTFRDTFPAKSSAALQRDLLGPETDALAADILASTLASLGLFDPEAAQADARTAHPLHDRWLHTSLDYLQQHQCRVKALDMVWAEWDAKKAGWLVNANLHAHVALLEACLRALPDILTGKRPATDVMFPNSSMELVEGLYKGYVLADYCNDALGATMAACIKSRLQADGRSMIRILEIGAGTGGTTTRVLPMLQAYSGAIAEYCYTDLSRAFLIHAQEKYQPQLPALTTAIFDASKPLHAQSVAMNHYDFVIATNVLHATPDIRETLRNAKALLKNQGVLLLNEMSVWSLYSHLTFGLLEGWWLYEDAALRLPGSPGLTPEKWKDVLEEEGFDAVSFMASEAHDLGLQIIAATSNGQVRQRLGTKPAAIASPAPKLDIAAPAVIATSAPRAEGSLREKCIAYLQEVVAKTLRMEASQVVPSRSLSDYGLDSILVVGLTNQLRKTFPGITSTLFFEVQNVAGLADYLLEYKREQVASVVGASVAVAPLASRVPSNAAVAQVRPAAPAAVAAGASSEGSLRERCIAYLREVVAKTLRLEASQIVPGRALADYGLDSILVVGLTNQLRKAFPGITSTLFFEVQNIAGLADYLLENKQEQLVSVLGASAPVLSSSPMPSNVALAQAQIMPAGAPARRNRRGQEELAPPASMAAPGSMVSSIFDVAIVGLSGRYPRARNLEEFWQNLANGRNCVTEIPADRWDWAAYYDPEKGKPGKTYTKWGAFLDDIDCFDPMFFKISPKEAKVMDPQERLFLESCYHAIEDAGHTPETLGDADKIGVFVGVMNSPYTPQPLYYSIANRVSFVLNFQGPSMAVDTACSSSLTAIHLALESMYSGLSECAIAGGVNLIIDPAHYLELSSFTMLSDGNQCKSFGEGADGFVDAEGIGAVVLKPLAKAERDGDHIYGVIKASAINAGGKTNGYTVPNPVAQAAVVSKALQRANVSAADISYIEAHGTGTALGDPIEVAGLKRAFEQFSKDRQFCAIGSLKSNIGHCESAAGIAALTKVLLQFKHKQLVPSLHAEVVNHEIDFAQTPFRLQRTLEAWPRPRRDVGGVIREIPRIAGISSFGAGGANAHIIVQEYEPAASATSVQRPPKVLVPLSARTGEQLKQKVSDLLNFVRASRRAQESVDLLSMAYTLQVGRETMEERLAFLVATVEELEGRLGAYLQGETAAQGVYRGRVKRNHEVTDPDMLQRAGQWASDHDLPNLADAWVKGVKVEWNRLYEGSYPRRLSLPTYPFARERYWRERNDVLPGAPKTTVDAVLHPLLHCNVSDIHQQCYRSTFSADEVCVTDHQIISDTAGRKVIPATVYLEMARAAVENATASLPGAVGGGKAMELFNIVWADPVVLTERKQVFVALFAQRDDQLGYEIYGPSDDGTEEIIHCQGQALLSGEPATMKIDLAQLKSQMRQGRRDAAAHYSAVAQADVQYGPSYQGIRSVHVGEKQLLAELAMPGTGADGAMMPNADFVLHPIMLDSALQAAFDLLLPENQPSLPLALESLRIFRACVNEMFAWVRYSPGGNAEHANLQLDIDLCDQQGNVCIQMRGLTYERELRRGLERPSELTASPAVRGRFPAAALEDAGLVLSAPDSQIFISAASPKPTQISLDMNG